MTKPLRFAIFGTGFWARFQLAAWRELNGIECVAFYNRTLSKAKALAQEFDVPTVYDDAERLLDREQLDFIDIITDVDTHAKFVLMAAERQLPVICQKPMAPKLVTAEGMVAACHAAGVPLFIHENWRWQTPIRKVAEVLASGEIGTPFRARIDMISGFPVFKNQPFLADLEQFILTDLGSHILDVARFLFGEAHSLTAQTGRIHPNIKGEDMATVMMRMGQGVTVVCNLAYAENYLERDRFPETYMFIEGDQGSLELGPDYWVRMTTKAGTLSQRCPPPRYSWADPAYDVVHSSIVLCNANLLGALRGDKPGETTGDDNLKTVRLVFASYDSAQQGMTLHFQDETA